MNDQEKREFGRQPIADIIDDQGVNSCDLVSASEEQLTYKMVSRAVKGRKLTLNVQNKVLHALNSVTKKSYRLTDLFNYTNSNK